MTNQLDHYISNHIKSLYRHKLFSPILYMILLIVLWIIFPIGTILSPKVINEKTSLDKLYKENDRYVSITLTDLKFTGYTQRIDDVAWAALKLEQANQYITPLSLGDVTGSDAIWSELSDMGVDWELHNGTGILLFLLPEETDLEQLNLCIFAGTESEDAHRYAQNAVAVQTVYEIPLTVTDSSDMEGMDV